MIAQTIIVGETSQMFRDNEKYLVSLNHWSGHITMPITKAQAQELITAAQQQDQLIRHQPSRAGRSSCQFKPGNQLTAVINESGSPDTLLSMVPYQNNTWLVWIAGQGDTFQIIPSETAAQILSSARSQAGRTQPTIIHHGRSHYLFIQPNNFAACLRPNSEDRPHGRVDVEDASPRELHQRFTAVWRRAAIEQ